MPKGSWKEYFVFSKKERTAIFILLGIIVLVICITFWYQPVFTSPHIDAATQKQLAKISAARQVSDGDTTDEETADSIRETRGTASAKIEHRLFYFDPNTLDSTGWRVLGFGEKTTSHILAYRRANKGFSKPDDLYKVSRIRKKTVADVLPYARMGSGLTHTSQTPKDATPPQQPTAQKTPAPATVAYKVINVNTATADDFKMFPGVSDAVAGRIIKFRTSIKGFTSVDDVAKTYGLADSSFKIMRPYLKL